MDNGATNHGRSMLFQLLHEQFHGFERLIADEPMMSEIMSTVWPAICALYILLLVNRGKCHVGDYFRGKLLHVVAVYSRHKRH